ncbi:MAG: hypothetical protein ABWZ64_09490, partial [Xanthobacteraceae bacterium]
MSETSVKSLARHRRLHPLPLRIMHWTNAIAMIVMIGSGWKIYEDEVLFGWLHFPKSITIGGEAARRPHCRQAALELAANLRIARAGNDHPPHLCRGLGLYRAMVRSQ